METRAHYVAVGSFVLTIIFLAFVAVLWLGRVQLRGGEYNIYEINFRGSVTGLSEGAPVLFNGVRVGRVIKIGLNPQNVEEVRVRVEIDRQVTIKTDSLAMLVSNLLSGVSYIQIRGTTQGAAPLTRKKGQPYPVIASERSTLERVSTRAPRLLERLIDVADNLNAFLTENNRKAVTETLANVQQLTADLASQSKHLGTLIDHTDATVTQLNTLFHDIDQSYVEKDGLRDQASQMLGGFNQLTKNLNDTNRQIQATIRENRPAIREFSQRGLPQLRDLINETRQFIAGLTRLVGEVERNPARFFFGNRGQGYKP